MVDDAVVLNAVVDQIERAFPHAKVDDRRYRPRHGYRAVHIVVRVGGRAVEIQIRTTLQHLWAELSEKLSDRVDRSIKYGGGGSEFRSPLATFSESILVHEAHEWFHADRSQRVELTSQLDAAYRQQLLVNAATIEARRLELIQMFQSVIVLVERISP